MKKLENLRVWRRDWYLKKIEKEFYFECRFRIRPGEWPGIIIEEKARTLEDIRAGVIEVELEVLVGMEEEILIQKEGRDLLIGFNPKFLMDVLRVIDDEEISIYLVNPKAPCFIKNEEESYIYLILPVNFNTAR